MSNRDPVTKPDEAKVNHDAVHAEVARYLTEPVSLQAVYENDSPDLLCDTEVLRRLLLFRGFITKIKHNGLRRLIPCTLRLIAALKFEVDFFAAVSPAYVELRKAGPVPNDRHLAWFSREMNAWLTQTQPRGGSLVADLLAHETIVVDLWQAGNGAAADPLPSTPRFVGDVRLRCYENDVLVAANKLSAGTFDPKTDWIKRDMNLVYHRAPGQSASILEVDPFLSLVFSLVDGKRSVDGIVTALAIRGLPEATQPVLHSVFCEMAERGLLEYGP